VGVISVRKSYYQDFGEIETPDDHTIVFKMKGPVAGVLELLASPFNCVYSAARLKSSANYPAREIMGSGAFEFVEHVQGSHWVGKRFEGYFKPGRPYLDGFKAYFVKSTAVIPGLLGGQFDAEFRFRTPPERDLLTEKLGDKVVVFDQALLGGNIFIFNTRRKPFDDIRVRQALTLAVDRWTGGENIGKISSLRYVGGVNRPGSRMALPEAELAKLPGYWKDAEKSRSEAQRLLKEAARRTWHSNFSIVPASKAIRLAASTPSTNGGASASRRRTSSSRPSSIRRTWRRGTTTSAWNSYRITSTIPRRIS
jgi:peptide/nickel transport system substrate-binding protein